MKRRHKIRIGLLVGLVIVVVIAIFSKLNEVEQKKAELSAHIKWDSEIEMAQPMGKRVLFWDGDYLISLNKSGVVEKKEERAREGLQAFFTEKHVFLYDSDLGKLYEYDEEATLKNTITISGIVFHIVEKNNIVCIQVKEEGAEVLYTLNQKGEVEEFFRTPNFILHFEIINPEREYVIAELSTSANGYKTTIYYKNGEVKKYDFQSEVAMKTWLHKTDVYLLTEKNLYRITEKETLQKEIPITTSVLMDGNKIFLLHSGILSEYNTKLEEKEKEVLAANISNLIMVDNQLYGIGTGDIAGQLMTEGQFYQKMGVQMDFTKISGKTVISVRENELWIYELVKDNSKANAEEEKLERETEKN